MTDLAIMLKRHGYRAIELDRQCRRGNATYASRLLGRRAVVLVGSAGARLFYDEEVVRRRDAVPPPLAGLLFGRGAVHGLDGDAHLRRKQLFLGQLPPNHVAGCAGLARERLRAGVETWRGREVSVHDELVQAYGGAVLAWAGIDLDQRESSRISRAYARIVNGFGFAGAAYPRAWAARIRTDRWARSLVRSCRDGRTRPEPGTVLAAIAASDLDDRTAAVELGNVLRPTIAVSWLGTFAVLALAELHDPDTAGDALAGAHDHAARLAFAEEVRRTTPFVPALAGRARVAAEHAGVAIGPGDFLVLDVPGINNDPEVYPQPEVFRPDRFLEQTPGPFDLVPQGGGYLEGHRCPGESMAVQLLEATADVLAGTDLTVVGPTTTDLHRIPTLPEGGLRVRAS